MLWKLQACKGVASELHGVQYICEMLFPVMPNFLKMIDAARANMEVVQECLDAKGSALLSACVAVTKTWDSNFRSWLGVNNVSDRNNRDIKKFMLQDKSEKDKRGEKQMDLKDRLAALATLVKRIGAATPFVPTLKAAVATAEDDEHTGRLYIA